jgi:riboflavin kinase/FMN adenylyltransferase
MKVCTSISAVERDENSVVSVGSFDGVHLGHRRIIEELKHRADVLGARSLVITFDPHPRVVVGRGPVEYLTTLHERLAMLEKLGVDETVVLPFTFEFSRMTPRMFYEEIVVRSVGVTEVIVGHDHMFGRDRTGGIQELQEIGALLQFSASEVPPVRFGEVVVSSSLIRSRLKTHLVEDARSYLGYPYGFDAYVEHGDERGRQIGFPTANLKPVHTEKLIPAHGVYLVRVVLKDEVKFGMMNIGVRPTLTEGQRVVPEVFIFDFDRDIYGAQLRVEFLRFIRDEKRFASKDELVAQLFADRSRSLNLLSGVERP